MALYRFNAETKSREEHMESGTIVAQSKEDAKKKLKALQFVHIYVKRVGGVKGFFGKFTAGIK